MIAILGAMDCEIQSLVAKLSSPRLVDEAPFRTYSGKLCGQDVVVAKTGVGKVLAASCTQRIIDTFAPRALICTGVAGALVPELNPGDIVIGADCIQHDFDARALGAKRGQIPYTDHFELHADPRLLAIASEFSPSPHALFVGRILSGDQFVNFSSDASAQYLRADLDGMAVEMEGASIGLVAKINAVPFLVIRTVSDRADGEAAVDFIAIMAEVAKNSCEVVEFIISRLAQLP